jgi:hypothetical protein
MPLLFLRKLYQEKLPVRVADPHEVRCVSLLLATGLVEAEFSLIRQSWRPGPVYVATVLRITDQGLAELSKIGADPASSPPVPRRPRRPPLL